MRISLSVRPLQGMRKLSLDSWLMVSAGVLVLLLLVQVVRYARAGSAHGLLVEADSSKAPPAREEPELAEKYGVITEKGAFGKPKKSSPPKLQVFGILGKSAWLGTSAKDAKPYEIGAEVPGGDKLIEIHLNSVVLEKGEKKRTLTVFPELPGAPGPAQTRQPDKSGPRNGPKADSPGSAPPSGAVDAAAGSVAPEVEKEAVGSAAGSVAPEVEKEAVVEQPPETGSRRSYGTVPTESRNAR